MHLALGEYSSEVELLVLLSLSEIEVIKVEAEGKHCVAYAMELHIYDLASKIPAPKLPEERKHHQDLER